MSTCQDTAPVGVGRKKAAPIKSIEKAKEKPAPLPVGMPVKPKEYTAKMRYTCVVCFLKCLILLFS